MQPATPIHSNACQAGAAHIRRSRPWKGTCILRSAATFWSTGVARESEALASAEAYARVERLPIPWRECLTPEVVCERRNLKQDDYVQSDQSWLDRTGIA